MIFRWMQKSSYQKYTNNAEEIYDFLKTLFRFPFG